jgi:hypothetical protein
MSHVGLLKAEKDGRVPARVDGMFDVEACRESISRNSHPIKAANARAQQVKPDADEGVVDIEGDESIREAARQLEWEKVRALKQKTDLEAGTLADVAEVNAFVAGMIIKARDDLSRIGSEIADRVAQESNPAECRKLIDDRIFQALEGLKQYSPRE